MKQQRKQHLQHAIDAGYALHHQGRSVIRQRRVRVMRRILDDLAILCRLPNQWRSLNTRHIDHLVAYWRQQTTQPTTIMKRLAVLRHFNQVLHLPWNIPTNQHYRLQAQPSASMRPTLQFHDVQNRLLHPVVKCVFGFECLLGLTRCEAVQLQPALHGRTDQLLHITRNIALHGKERDIPILTDDQRQLITAWRALLPTPFTALSEQWPMSRLQPVYRASLQDVGLKGNIRYRFYYVHHRHQQLAQQPFKQQLQILHQETGLSFSHIRSLIHEQTKIK